MVTALKRDTGGPAEKHRQPCKEFYHENQPSQTLRRSAGRGADHVLRFIFEKRCPPNRRYRRREKRDEMQTILIIDDDAAIGDLEQEVLEREGYGVQRAYSGTEALLLLKNSHPDLILLDLMLPGLSGEALLPKLAGSPVIVVSADTPDCTESSLKTHISNLRGKLREASGKDYIEAVWGIGFRLRAET